MTTVTVAIATSGRRGVISDTLGYLKSIECGPVMYSVCPANKRDIDEKWISKFKGQLRVYYGKEGSSAQRNTLIDNCDTDIILFLDDDFLPAKDYLSELVSIFDKFHDVVVTTGSVIADGILIQGYKHDEGIKLLEADRSEVSGVLEEVYNGYGCNLAARMEHLLDGKIRFDENLPMYGWLEDLDFSRQLSHFGKVVRSPRLRGVHLGTKLSGRSPGKKLGYSQVANPIYLLRKGTMSRRKAFEQIARNVVANLVRCYKPEAWIDRAGRRAGNWLAFKDLLSDKLTPLAIKNIE